MAAWNGNWKTRKYFSSDWCRRTGVCLGGGGKSTHYVRAIAVFKTSLSLCVTHLSCFWTDGDGGSQEEGGEDWLVVIYKHCVLWLPFPRLKHKKRLVTHQCFFSFFFSTPAFSLSFSYKCTHWEPANTPPFLSNTHTHTHTKAMHSYTHPGAPWLLNCHCSEITALRTRPLDLKAGISCKPLFYFY